MHKYLFDLPNSNGTPVAMGTSCTQTLACNTILQLKEPGFLKK